MARKFKNYRGGYNESPNIKKILLIVGAAVLGILLIAAISVGIFLATLSLGDEPQREPTFYVQSMPEKTTYYIGEAPSWYSLQMTLITETGNRVTLGPESCIITGFDSSKPAQNQVITVKYGQYTATFTVNIVDREQEQQKPENGQFDGLSFKVMPKTQYKVGEWLDLNDAVLLLHYDNGATKEIPMTYDMVHNFTTAKPGTYTLTVLYIEDGKRSTLTYDITVTE